jgi:hypothetical protein
VPLRDGGTVIPLLSGTVRIRQGKKNSGQSDRESEILLFWPDFRKNTISTHSYYISLCAGPCVTSAALLQPSLLIFGSIGNSFPNEVYERL